MGDLLITYVFDLPRYFRHVNRKDCLDLGIRQDELRALSVRNLVRSRPKPEIRPGQAGIELLERAIDTVWERSEQRLQLSRSVLVRRSKSWRIFDRS